MLLQMILQKDKEYIVIYKSHMFHTHTQKIVPILDCTDQHSKLTIINLL